MSCAVLLALWAGSASVTAREPVTRLADLIGARATAVDRLDSWDLSYQRGEQAAGMATTYWIDNVSGRCVAVRVSDGRISAIDYADGCVEPAPPLEPEFFQTVCGVIRGGEIFRYRCQARDDTDNGDRITVLRFPDNEVKFVWHGDRDVTLERAGTVPEQATYATSEGETDVFTAEMTYFYISNRDMAALEVLHFDD